MVPDGPDLELGAVQGLVRVEMGGVPSEEPDRVGGMEMESSCHAWVTRDSYGD